MKDAIKRLKSYPNLTNLKRIDYKKAIQVERNRRSFEYNKVHLWNQGYEAGYLYAIRRLESQLKKERL